MAEPPFGPSAGGAGRPRRGGAARDARPRTDAVQRSFRCRHAVRRELPPQFRYTDYLAMHEDAAHPDAEARRLWLVGLGAAFVAAILAFGSAYVIRVMSGLAVPSFVDRTLAPGNAGVAYAICSGAVTLQLTALVQILVATADRPVRAFLWTGGFLVVLVTALPLLVGGPIQASATTALLDLCGGAAAVAVLAAAASVIGPPPRIFDI
ncbi:hypothetical protein [Actinomadura rupiterrae]|uniref:hypothetical protein n=1 Tax=Actinomadura rupiterrae TaxID=559627 RepID=UPI0020A50A0C|nr:hypothetical protein [Actinomadura rupiterrae]MCP2335767.1 hypothetical protein [Actinomadura rupiterrae]